MAIQFCRFAIWGIEKNENILPWLSNYFFTIQVRYLRFCKRLRHWFEAFDRGGREATHTGGARKTTGASGAGKGNAIEEKEEKRFAIFRFWMLFAGV